MDVLKKKRKTHRTQVTRLLSEAQDLLQSATPTVDDLGILIERLSLARDQLNHVDAAIESLISERDAEAEFTQVIDYNDKIVTCPAKLK